MTRGATDLDAGISVDDTPWRGPVTILGKPRFWLRLARDRLRAVEIEDIYYLEATGQTTRVRIQSARALRDLRSLGELTTRLAPHGLFRIHRNHAVNLAHVRELRRRSGIADWEVRLEPPVNKVLPVSRSRLTALREALEISADEARELDARDDDLEEDIRAGRPLGKPWSEVRKRFE